MSRLSYYSSYQNVHSWYNSCVFYDIYWFGILDSIKSCRPDLDSHFNFSNCTILHNAHKTIELSLIFGMLMVISPMLWFSSTSVTSRNSPCILDWTLNCYKRQHASRGYKNWHAYACILKDIRNILHLHLTYAFIVTHHEISLPMYNATTKLSKRRYLFFKTLINMEALNKQYAKNL